MSSKDTGFFTDAVRYGGGKFITTPAADAVVGQARRVASVDANGNYVEEWYTPAAGTSLITQGGWSDPDPPIFDRSLDISTLQDVTRVLATLIADLKSANVLSE